jgi:hypothetical protein
MLRRIFQNREFFRGEIFPKESVMRIESENIRLIGRVLYVIRKWVAKQKHKAITVNDLLLNYWCRVRKLTSEQL